jgi:type IV secretory pathway TrbD component
MYDRGDHYLGNNAWASSGDGIPADNWELAGGRPRPASPSLSSVPKQPAPPPAPRLPGSVKVSKPITATPKRPVPQASIGSAPSTTPSTSASRAKHRVFLALQQDKLLMGGERELSQMNITITMLLGLIAVMTLNWHLAVVAVLFGGPVQWAIRIESEKDPDYVKTYLEALVTPHIRKPE